MNTYRIALMDKRLNQRRILDIKSDTCLNAMKDARKQLAGLGFNDIESARCIYFEGISDGQTTC